MAEWKKIVVSGSDISQLNNDSGYLSSTGTIDSASVAARATTLSPDATASFADLASDARTADSASVSARATLLSPDATASFADLASDARTADSASVAARATTLSDLATASFADLASDARTATSASFATQAGSSRAADSASVAARATTLSPEATASFADLASDARTATSASIAATAGTASVADRATLLSDLATASFADVAGTARAADSSSVAARATELSADATASYADLAGTVHDGNITTDKIAAGAVTNAKLANDSVTLGTTEVDLGQTITSISGLDSISATTGSFVLQVFESSSTIITSGSNIFGDKQDDIQQITGSLKQTGSFTLSGSLLQSHGVISGSFQGDGSGLTGLATNLTVDGDTGTQDVDLLQDDLQILGTTSEINTAVTKVGNDVKVTLSLPDSIEATASVATRANALAPTATASFADLASDARTATSASFATQAGSSRNADSASVAARATELSADATASFADLASDARTATSASFATQAGSSRAADSASVAARATTLSDAATASFADVAGTARNADSASVAARATTLSNLATASFADVAGTVHDGNITTDKIADGAVTNIKLANDSVTIGTTEVDLGQTVTSLVGLENISAATGTFVYQIFESSSTIITSGSNVFGNDENDIQQFTGSILQTGSMVISGSLDVAVGTISGSFVGSGAGLTGIIADTADSASVAARATTLSPEATASFADLASDARTADSASVAARATTLSPLATASFADLASDARTSDSASVAARATTLSADATASFADLASDARTATSASFATQAGTSRAADSASVAARATELSDLATASFADVAGTARTTDSASVAARATTLSADATASYADLAGTVHDGNITNAKIAVGTIANDRLVNDSVTLGTTEVDLGQTVTSIVGLENISAATGTFVYQIFESSSTIITSGSNVFGNDENDIQQFTGSILQTGSMIISGGLDVAVGQISGSFVGDGSGLTGLATVLTVDGDTGTQNVDLIADDLQFLGTTDRIDTVVTKVGNDVKVTFDLPDTIEVTASVAARATTLSADATASFADLASVARNADSASNAVNAVSASATTAGLLFPAADGLVNQALVTDGNGQLEYGDIFGTGSTKKLDQSVAAATWSFAHNLNELYPIVQVYDTTGDQLLPERIESIDVNNVKLYFATDTAGVAAAMVGGMGISASNATRATSASIADEASTLSATATASFADLASVARTADSASVAARATELSDLATASFADVAGDARTATSASHATSGAGAFSGSFIGDGSGLTGLATVLTLDGDTGTQNVDLIDDDLQIIGTAGEIATAVTKVGNDVKVTLSLPDDVTIGNDLTVTGDATIAGDLVVGGAIVSASSLEVADQFIILASGSNGAIDGGIIVNQVDDDPDGRGKAFAYDSSANRWALQSELVDSATTITPDAYMGVIQESAGAPSSDPTYGGTNGKGTIFVDTSNNEAYIYI